MLSLTESTAAPPSFPRLFPLVVRPDVPYVYFLHARRGGTSLLFFPPSSAPVQSIPPFPLCSQALRFPLYYAPQPAFFSDAPRLPLLFIVESPPYVLSLISLPLPFAPFPLSSIRLPLVLFAVPACMQSRTCFSRPLLPFLACSPDLRGIGLRSTLRPVPFPRSLPCDRAGCVPPCTSNLFLVLVLSSRPFFYGFRLASSRPSGRFHASLAPFFLKRPCSPLLVVPVSRLALNRAATLSPSSLGSLSRLRTQENSILSIVLKVALLPPPCRPSGSMFGVISDLVVLTSSALFPFSFLLEAPSLFLAPFPLPSLFGPLPQHPTLAAERECLVIDVSHYHIRDPPGEGVFPPTGDFQRVFRCKFPSGTPSPCSE